MAAEPNEKRRTWRAMAVALATRWHPCGVPDCRRCRAAKEVVDEITKEATTNA